MDNPHVLLVDDDQAILRLLRKWLEPEGFLIELAGNGLEAIAKIEANCPQILVTDWEMPQMDGMELCRWVRQQELPNYLYTIFLTVRSDSKDLVCGLREGADDFVRKPVDKSEMLARLHAAVRVLELEDRLSALAKCDPLTGLATQRTFYEQGQREWARSKRYHIPLSCVMVDIDFFKQINDTRGHAVGDEVIQRVAAILAQNCRDSDYLSRYGGEEFCVLLPETDEQNASLWANRIRGLIANSPELREIIDDDHITVTASFGVAQSLVDTATPRELVDLADQALLVAKRSGRDRVVNFQSLNDTKLFASDNSPSTMFAGIRASDVMTTIVANLNYNDQAGRAAEYFLRFRINSAPVVDDDGTLVGILAEKDVMAIMLWPNWGETKISEIMKRNVVCYDEQTSVLVIYEFLCRVAIRSVVIVADGRPTGIISRGSVLRWFTNSLDCAPSATGGGLAPTGESAQSVRNSLISTCDSVRKEAEGLERQLQSEAGDVVPCLVAAASRMQELVNDLLANSSFLHLPAAAGAAGPGQVVGFDTVAIMSDESANSTKPESC